MRSERGTGAKPRAPGSGRADLCARIGLVMMCLEGVEERRDAADHSYFTLMHSRFQRVCDSQGRATGPGLRKLSFAQLAGTFFGGKKALDPRCCIAENGCGSIVSKEKMPSNVGLRHESSWPCRQVVGLR